MSRYRSPPSSDGRRIVVCDYSPPLPHSIVGILRLGGFYRVFQAHDGLAVKELCALLSPHVDLLVLHTNGTGLETSELIREVRAITPELRILHIGAGVPPGLPDNVTTSPEPGLNPDQLLRTVDSLLGDEDLAETRLSSHSVRV